MKKLISMFLMVVFVAGITFAQNPPAKKTEKKEAKTEMKTHKKDSTLNTTKKESEHKQHQEKKK